MNFKDQKVAGQCSAASFLSAPEKWLSKLTRLSSPIRRDCRLGHRRRGKEERAVDYFPLTVDFEDGFTPRHHQGLALD